MKIAGDNPYLKLGAYVKNIKNDKEINVKDKEASKEVGNEVITGDKVDISSKAKEIREAKMLLNSLPDIREEKVAQIKERVENGSYQIEEKKTAAKMIKGSLLDELL